MRTSGRLLRADCGAPMLGRSPDPLEHRGMGSEPDITDLLLAWRAGERLSRVVECGFVGGLTEEETAEALTVTPRHVRRDWVKAKGWLYQALEPRARSAICAARPQPGL